MGQVILHTTHSLKQCETITHTFFWELDEMIILEVNKSRCIEMKKYIKTLLKLSKN